VGRRRSLNELGWHPLRVEDGMRRSEKAEVPEETEPEVRRLRGPRTSGTYLHTNDTPNTQQPGFGWRIHCGVEATESSTNKQHSLYC